MNDIKILTGFHAVEERIRKYEKSKNKEECSLVVKYSSAGPRVKKILEQAKKNEIQIQQVADSVLEKIVSTLPETARDHRGIILEVKGDKTSTLLLTDFSQFLATITNKEVSDNTERKSIVVVLDSITDPHNVGAIIRSCDQFAIDLVILPERKSATDSEIIARASAGAASWVPVSIVPNLVRTIEQLKDKGYWVYGADAGGESVKKINFADKVVLIMGSEGSGISRLLKEKCDSIVSIPTYGKLDSLNVSVATGILLYELKN